jgi:hypothetical protein
MRQRALLLAFVVSLAVAGTPAAAGVEHGSERGQFALAGWASTNQATGEEHFAMIQTSGPLTGDATVAYSDSSSAPYPCPDGSNGLRATESSGETTGTLRVTRNLSGASLTASALIETVRTTYCGNDVTSVTRRRSVRLSFSLTGVGRRFTETSGSFIKVPSAQVASQHTRSIVRNANGSFRVGTVSHPLVFGDFGRITGVWHTSGDAALAARRFNLLSTPTALRSILATQTGSLDRADALWEQAGSGRYTGLYAGADHVRSGETVVYLSGYSAREKTCADGTTALRERIATGEGPGALLVRGNHAAATARGRITVMITTVDGCTGAETMTQRTLTVGVDLAATDRTRRGGEWLRLHNPPAPPRWVTITSTGRQARGRLAIGGQHHAADGAIATITWRDRSQTPAPRPALL